MSKREVDILKIALRHVREKKVPAKNAIASLLGKESEGVRKNIWNVFNSALTKLNFKAGNDIDITLIRGMIDTLEQKEIKARKQYTKTNLRVGQKLKFQEGVSIVKIGGVYKTTKLDGEDSLEIDRGANAAFIRNTMIAGNRHVVFVTKIKGKVVQVSASMNHLII